MVGGTKNLFVPLIEQFFADIPGRPGIPSIPAFPGTPLRPASPVIIFEQLELIYIIIYLNFKYGSK